MTAAPRNPIWLAILRAALFAVTATVGGCAGNVHTDPLKVVNNPLRETSDRIAAVNQLAPTSPKGPVLKSLAHLVWTEREPLPLREAAADRLIALDPAMFQGELRDNLLDVQRWPMLRFLLTCIQAHHWQKLTGLVMRSWARQSKIYPDAKRPERTVLEKLNPDQSVRQTLIDAFQARWKNNSIDVQAAAWTILARMEKPASLREILAHATPDTLLVGDLQRAATTLNQLPHNREGLLWLVDLQVEHKSLWQNAAAVAGRLTPAQHMGLAIRHIPALTHLPAPLLGMPRDQLLALVRGQLARRTHAPRIEDTHTHSLEHLPAQTLAAHRSAMCWADLAQVELLIGAMRAPGFAPSVFAQADADRLDKSSEHGGVITWQNGGIIAKAFPPEFRGQDDRYIASDKMIHALYTGLAHYHFHAQHFNNAKWAGPGPGDLKLINRLGTAAVVFTFINRHTINVDYYKPGNVIIDLGMLRR